MAEKKRPDKKRVRLARAIQERRENTGVGRRQFIAAGAAMLGGATLLGATLHSDAASAREKHGPPVRPPTAGSDDEAFQKACIRCGLCGVVCQNGCIRMFGADEPTWGGLTPYLDVRRRSCTLCMRCTNICPTGALSATKDNLEAIVEKVNMGIAVVDPDRCLSYIGRICGYCHDACPLPGKAIKLVPAGKPVVLEDGCVGCGRCVEFCPQVPTAIDVRPAAAEVRHDV